jgi:hypothetical protein
MFLCFSYAFCMFFVCFSYGFSGWNQPFLLVLTQLPGSGTPVVMARTWPRPRKIGAPSGSTWPADTDRLESWDLGENNQTIPWWYTIDLVLVVSTIYHHISAYITIYQVESWLLVLSKPPKNGDIWWFLGDIPWYSMGYNQPSRLLDDYWDIMIDSYFRHGFWVAHLFGVCYRVASAE